MNCRYCCPCPSLWCTSYYFYVSILIAAYINLLRLMLCIRIPIYSMCIRIYGLLLGNILQVNFAIPPCGPYFAMPPFRSSTLDNALLFLEWPISEIKVRRPWSSGCRVKYYWIIMIFIGIIVIGEKSRFTIQWIDIENNAQVRGKVMLSEALYGIYS